MYERAKHSLRSRFQGLSTVNYRLLVGQKKNTIAPEYGTPNSQNELNIVSQPIN